MSKYQTPIAQIIYFAQSQFKKGLIDILKLELIRKLCLNDNKYLFEQFHQNQKNEVQLLEILRSLNENDVLEDRFNCVESQDIDMKIKYKNDVKSFIANIDNLYRLIFKFTTLRLNNEELLLKQIVNLFGLDLLICFKLDHIKQIVTVVGQNSDMNEVIEFKAFASLISKQDNISLDNPNEMFYPLIKSYNVSQVQQVVYTHLQMAVLIHPAIRFDEKGQIFTSLMNQVFEVNNQNPAQITNQSKVKIINAAQQYLGYLCHSEDISYQKSRLKTTSQESKQKMKNSHLIFLNSIQRNHEQLNNFKQDIGRTQFDFDQKGNLFYANLQHQTRMDMINPRFSFQNNYMDVFTCDSLIIDIEQSKNQNYTLDNSRYQIFTKYFLNKLQGITVIISCEIKQQQNMTGSMVEKQSILSKFKKVVSQVRTINRQSKAVASKQLLFNNPTYRKTYMMEYLSDKDMLVMKQDLPKNTTRFSTLKNLQKEERKPKGFPIEFSHLAQFSIIEFVVNSDLQIDLQDPDQDFLRYDDNTKLMTVFQMLLSFDIPNLFKVDIAEFRTFLFLLRHHYNKRNNPFHNFDHALTVMHGCYFLCRQEPVASIFDVFQKYALILTGLCHDLDHRATTNLFLVNSGDKLAMRYLEKSVLENHHTAVALKLMANPNSDILKNLEPQQKSQLKKYLINNILATDIKEHFSQLGQFESKLNQYQEGFQKFESEEQKLHLQGILTHAADFFGSTKPLAISSVWSTKINQEFTKQYETEIKLEFPATMYFKDLDKLQNQAKGELGFLRIIVRPLWELLNKFYDGGLQNQIKNMDVAMEHWEQIQNQSDSLQQD